MILIYINTSYHLVSSYYVLGMALNAFTLFNSLQWFYGRGTIIIPIFLDL
jgi:hypothetical protein